MMSRIPFKIHLSPKDTIFFFLLNIMLIEDIKFKFLFGQEELSPVSCHYWLSFISNEELWELHGEDTDYPI